MPKILITGAAGQLGWELQRRAPADCEIVPMDAREMDITDATVVADMVASIRPDWIINAAAYTAVDKAEEQQDLAYAINADGVRHLATAAKAAGAKVLLISTDFVFNGEKSTPYTSDDIPDPVSYYGMTKLMGERALQETLADDHVIIRTSWLYSSHGHNFVKTMLRLMGERDQLNIVADQIGTPTWAAGLADVIYRSIAADIRGVYGWSDQGVASWYDFTLAIQELALDAGLLVTPISIQPIPTSAYPTAATRPAFSVLDKAPLQEALGITGQHWRESLKSMLQELTHG